MANLPIVFFLTQAVAYRYNLNYIPYDKCDIRWDFAGYSVPLFGEGDPSPGLPSGLDVDLEDFLLDSVVARILVVHSSGDFHLFHHSFGDVL